MNELIVYITCNTLRYIQGSFLPHKGDQFYCINTQGGGGGGAVNYGDYKLVMGGSFSIRKNKYRWG